MRLCYSLFINMKQIVIAGAGFGGMRLVRALKKRKDIHVTLINDSPDFRYTPALYRAATGFKMIEGKLPLEWLLSDINNVSLVVGSVESIDADKKYFALAGGDIIPYDTAVISLGSVTTFFNIEGIHEHAFGIKSPSEIIELKKHIHESMQETNDIDKNYVIIGGGPTGVELATAFCGYIREVAKKHKTKHRNAKVVLVEAAPRVLPTMNESASKIALKKLRRLGVKILLNTKVTKETVNQLKTEDGIIPTHTVIWTAGAANNPFFENNSSQFKLNDRKKVIVNKHLKSSSNVFVIGDNAATKFSGLALTAVLQANYVAKLLKGRKTKGFKQFSPVQVVPVGKKSAILQWHHFVLGGYIAHTVRQIADILGYTDIMGLSRALDIARIKNNTEENCQTCSKSSRRR